MRHKHRRRCGATSPAVIILLAGIFVTLVVLAIVLLKGVPGTSNDDKTKTEKTNKTEKTGEPPKLPPGPITRAELPEPPLEPKPIGDPDRIKEVVQKGKTYDVILTGGFDAQVVDKDWGMQETVHLAFKFETEVQRVIEENDGKRIIELRHFKKVQAVKLDSKVEDFQIDLGGPGVIALGLLEFVQPGSAAAVISVKPVAEAIVGAGREAVIADAASKAFAQINSLSGKKVRITFVDGVGVESIEPVDCSLTEDERDILFNTAILSDYHLMPNLDIKVGGRWTVDGREMAGYLDPSTRGVPSGEVYVVRESNQDKNGKQYAILRMERGILGIDSSDASARRIGTFEPQGKLQYNVTDGHVETASLNGDITLEEVSKDHILFEASFKTQPKIRIDYWCKMH